MKIIGKSMYGIKYASDKLLPLNIPSSVQLKFGDIVINGKGLQQYANTCIKCNKVYLAGTLMFVLERGPCCYLSLKQYDKFY